MTDDQRSQEENAFQQAAGQPRRTLAAEFIGFLRDNKKWWLVPILAMFLLLGLLAVLGPSGSGPFIYSLF